MIESSGHEIIVEEEFSQPTFLILLEYLYTNRVQVSAENVVEVLSIANGKFPYF
jgi:hypothetical protein